MRSNSLYQCFPEADSRSAYQEIARLMLDLKFLATDLYSKPDKSNPLPHALFL
jgi:hypothetical protein